MASSTHIDTLESSSPLYEARHCLAENRPEEAVKIADTWLLRDPHDVEAKIILSQGLLRMGKLDRLRQLLSDIDSEIEQLSLVYLRLGELCRQSGLQAESERFCNKYVSLKNALSSDMVPQEDAAGTETGEKIAEEPEVEAIFPEFHTITMAELYMSQGHFERARTVLDNILSRDPQNEEIIKKLLEIDKAMSLHDDVFSFPSDADDNRPLIARLEEWLSRISHGESRDL